MSARVEMVDMVGSAGGVMPIFSEHSRADNAVSIAVRERLPRRMISFPDLAADRGIAAPVGIGGTA
jgi:hypothetical protein